jgi:hypothetical protein
MQFLPGHPDAFARPVPAEAARFAWRHAVWLARLCAVDDAGC